MKEILMLGQISKEDAILGLIALLLVLSVISLRQISVTKRKLNRVVKTVQDYLDALCREEAEGLDAAQENVRKIEPQAQKKDENTHKSSMEEEQNRIISAVLQEIFP